MGYCAIVVDGWLSWVRARVLGSIQHDKEYEGHELPHCVRVPSWILYQGWLCDSAARMPFCSVL